MWRRSLKWCPGYGYVKYSYINNACKLKGIACSDELTGNYCSSPQLYGALYSLPAYCFFVLHSFVFWFTFTAFCAMILKSSSPVAQDQIPDLTLKKPNKHPLIFGFCDLWKRIQLAFKNIGVEILFHSSNSARTSFLW